MKNLLTFLLLLTSTTSVAAPDGIISIYYYKTSAKQELVGYWYQSCYLGFNTLWSRREGYRVLDSAMHGWDCTQLGVSANSRSFCNSKSPEKIEIVETIWDEGLQKYVIQRAANGTSVLAKAQESNLEQPLFGGF